MPKVIAILLIFCFMIAGHPREGTVVAGVIEYLHNNKVVLDCE